jgi:hypothetical protein
MGTGTELAVYRIFERLRLFVVRRERVGRRQFAQHVLGRGVDPRPAAIVDRDLVVPVFAAGGGEDPVAERRDHQAGAVLEAEPLAQLVPMLGDPGERRLCAVPGTDQTQSLVPSRGVGDRVQDAIMKRRSPAGSISASQRWMPRSICAESTFGVVVSRAERSHGCMPFTRRP